MQRRKRKVSEIRQTIGGIEKYASHPYQKAAGVILFFIGFIFILNSLSGMTGFAIAESIGKIPSSIIGLIFIIGGILLFVRGKESNLALEVKKSGAIITDPRRLRKIANKMGYEGRWVKEGYQVLGKNGRPLTVIPNHNISTGVCRSVIDVLSTGKSNFRKRIGYSSA